MLTTMLPVGSALFVKLAFSAAKKYPRECKTARIDIDRRMTRVICDWRDKSDLFWNVFRHVDDVLQAHSKNS